MLLAAHARNASRKPRAACSQRHLALSRVHPQPFQIVKRPLLRREDVYDDAAAIQKNPVSVVVAFDSGDARPGTFEGTGNALGNGPRLNLRSSRQNNERVGDDAFAGNIDLDEIFGFLLECRFADSL